jgi:hypothetical protein
MKKNSRFRIGEPSSTVPTDPESLFRDLKQRSPRIQYLWSHQADILRTWHQNYQTSKDVALELPTGTGKTLIGLLIAEYRRRALGERVLYLCLTRQLANQVSALAKDYGIQAFVLVGDQAKYQAASFSAYASGRAVAITTYSGIFNTNPRLKDANCLVLDDAHSAEDYISSLWTLSIDRFDQRDLYFAVLDIFKGAVRDSFISIMESDDPSPITRRAVDKVPFPIYLERLAYLKDLFKTATCDSIRYPWIMNNEHMHACNMFISWSSICVRPIIPPTLTHPPFALARHRVYMSATLGSGGELERITGVPKIERIPVSEGWDRQSIGRRFFVVPGYALNEVDVDKVLWQSIDAVERSVVLCPDRLAARRVEAGLASAGIERAILSAQDIEESLATFTSSTEAVLILAGRYDGLDLEGEACRLMVVYGLPSAHNAQEDFLLSRLRATSLLRDRIRTRLTQAFGRCTRGPTDYAAVILVGSALVDFCSKKEVSSGMHPELQAELEYGLQVSAANTVDNWRDLLAAFLEQDKDWQDAEDWIKRYRDKARRVTDSAAEVFLSVAADEVDYLYMLWKDDYDGALAKARTISDALSGDEVTGYRAWWYYLAGSVAWLIARTTQDSSFISIAKDFFTRAAKCPTAISWFAALTRIEIMAGLVSEVDEPLRCAAENIEELLIQLGLHGPKFEKITKESLDLINKNESVPFAQGLEQLGKFLGFESWRPQAQGAPDCIWSLSDKVCIALEAKSEETLEGAIPIRDAREAKGHADWVSSNVKLIDGAKTLVILVSPRSMISKEALPHAKRVYYVSVAEMRTLAQQASGVLRTIRAQSTERAEGALRANIQQRLLDEQLDPQKILERLQTMPLRQLPQG